MKTNQSNETTMKVISITIMAVTVNKNNNLHRSKKYKHFKGAQSRLNGLKSLAKLFKIRCLQSVSIFSILNHPCSIMVYYYLFDVFLCL